jgi:hypothetical protein
VFELIHAVTATRIGRYESASDALEAFERIRAENPELASEVALLTPDEADVVAHTALEFGQ